MCSVLVRLHRLRSCQFSGTWPSVSVCCLEQWVRPLGGSWTKWQVWHKHSERNREGSSWGQQTLANWNNYDTIHVTFDANYITGIELYLCKDSVAVFLADSSDKRRGNRGMHQSTHLNTVGKEPFQCLWLRSSVTTWLLSCQLRSLNSSRMH